MPQLRRMVVLALLALVALLALECATPTALTVTVYSEVSCAKGSAVTLVGGTTLAELPQKAPSSVSTICGDDGRMGSVVLVPAGAKDETVAFAVMQRADGQPADACLDPAQTVGCIVAKRQLRFETHNESTMRVDMRLSCLGVLCSPEATCVRGACVDAQTNCGGSCDERNLSPDGDGGAPDTGAPEGGTPEAGAREVGAPDAADASATSGLLALAISAGTLSPAFRPTTLGYGVASSVVSLGVPFTVTPTFGTGTSVTINGAPVLSGAASPVIALNLLAPTAVDVTVTLADAGTPTHYAIVVPPVQEAYAKASNTRTGGQFGFSIALSGDTLAVGAYADSSNATGINGNQADTSAPGAGAVYVFTRNGTSWSQQAYLKASNTRPGAEFGAAIALSGDTLAVGAEAESSNATGINGNQANASTGYAGAVYVFTRSGTTWSQQAYVKASNTRPSGQFGYSVALSGDTLAVGANGESSNATGINGNQANASAGYAGAVYVFTRSGTTWLQQAYLKASNTQANANFGFSIALSSDTLVVGAYAESSNATGINGNQADTSATVAGAAYVFTRSVATWSQQAYLKASNTRAGAQFGISVALSEDTLAVGALDESSNATGIDGNQADTSASGSGAVYVFTRTGTSWSQQAYVKASNTQVGCAFGASVALSVDTLAVGAYNESSSATGVNGNQAGTSAAFAGAAYVFRRSGTTWSQQAYIKASNTRADADFGTSVTLSVDTLAVGGYGDSSNATGINGNQGDTSQSNAGAVYVVR